MKMNELLINEMTYIVNNEDGDDDYVDGEDDNNDGDDNGDYDDDGMNECNNEGTWWSSRSLEHVFVFGDGEVDGVEDGAVLV